ncbi:hypothetical protein BFAG_03850 [Bacteroides fragilis 3_1_12]|uniref:Uncharacterized protein n=1 Tax=Bacteroides fragilis 3_1_12 TaxID=457424 RepID=A0ABN0BQE7_BACFG|nr:hypothetical protein BFAG_03850 [Bacteroides fragilis 3_1_12]
MGEFIQLLIRIQENDSLIRINRMGKDLDMMIIIYCRAVFMLPKIYRLRSLV